MTTICVHCGAQRPHEARGLCRLCYEKARLRGLHTAYPKTGRAPAAARTDYWRTYKRQYRKGQRNA